MFLILLEVESKLRALKSIATYNAAIFLSRKKFTLGFGKLKYFFWNVFFPLAADIKIHTAAQWMLDGHQLLGSYN